ncbi:OB-fold protein [Buttiauxella agrestis]|uniref:OB-fold protein n=1 Tax=Buttiauxella agrestis TaxID=82977 RepID=UPI0015618CA5|nr:hypothetical protein [Buttiauxella agrestis]BCG08757.1 hypothetical protein BADSM9389_14160 [Buttiauxella agrestis]
MKFNIGMTLRQFVILVIAGLVGVWLALPAEHDAPEAVAEQAAQGTPLIETSAENLAKDFSDNEAAADLKYRGHNIAVTGRIIAFNISLGKPSVTLKGSEKQFTKDGEVEGGDVTVFISQEQAASLTKGQTVRFIGNNATRIIGDVALYNGAIYTAPEPEPKPVHVKSTFTYTLHGTTRINAIKAKGTPVDAATLIKAYADGAARANKDAVVAFYNIDDSIQEAYKAGYDDMKIAFKAYFDNGYSGNDPLNITIN